MTPSTWSTLDSSANSRVHDTQTTTKSSIFFPASTNLSRCLRRPALVLYRSRSTGTTPAVMRELECMRKGCLFAVANQTSFLCNPRFLVFSGMQRGSESQGLNRILKHIQFLHSNCLDAIISSESNLNPLNILNHIPLFQSAPNS
jgi:hypothetical protein